MENKLISIIIPSYNRRDFICRAIDSVLKQNYNDIEIIIVDDGSTDGTLEFLKEQYKNKKNIFLYKNEKNSGAGFSRKVGYSKARGAYLIFMDDDDYYTNYEFFKHAIDIFSKMKNVGMVSSSSTIEYVKENKFEDSIMNIKGLIEKSEYLSEFQQKYMKSSSTFTTIFRKQTLDEANFDNVEMVNDSSIYLRALIAGDAYILDEISGVYRVHSKNITFNLSVDFIIENLIEKRKVYDEIIKRKLLEDTDEWLKKQVLLTTEYYVQYNNTKDEDFTKLISWCENNSGAFSKEIVNKLKVLREKNKKKKVFLMAYARQNLGDDLFIKMLLDRYPMQEFYMKIKNPEFLSELDKSYNNLHIIEGMDTDEELFNTDVNKYDTYIYIGGSIFMEGGKVYNLSPKFYDFIKRCKQNNKSFCYVSCNYGPYQTQEYFNLSRKTFAECTDICFRDKYSYNLFKDIKTVRYAPDFAFTYPINKKDKIKNSVGISIIDLSIRKDLKNKEQDYLNMLIRNIKKYLDDGKSVYLYSFCQHEGDEKTIDRILEKFKDNDKIKAVKYDGNIDKFLSIYSQMEYMICSRFHAMILSSIANQKMYIMSYSKKIDNVLEDLKIQAPIIYFKDINSELEINLNSFKSVENSLINSIIEKAANQENGVKKAIME